MATVPERDGQAVACTTEQTQLGEGIRWDARRGELLAVDILAGRVARGLLRKDGLIERIGVYQLPGTVGMIAPIQGDDGWVLGAGRGFAHLALDGTQRTIAQVAPAGTRMNDGACDPQGRFWGGTLADDHHTGGGALYRLDWTGRTEVVLEGLTISNGIGWSPDGRTMYLVDSGPRVVHAFTFDGDRGTISAGRVLVTVPEHIGAPDGMTVDAAGDLWVAIYGGGRVNHYAPDGSLRDVYPIPARECTCCAFGGPGLHRLFVTTATGAGPTCSAAPISPPAWPTGWTQMPPAGRQRRSARIRRGGKALPGEGEPTTSRPTGVNGTLPHDLRPLIARQMCSSAPGRWASWSSAWATTGMPPFPTASGVRW